MPDLKTANKKMKELQDKGKSVVDFKQVIHKVNIPAFGFSIFLGDDFRRLILKMCLAYSRRMNIDQKIIEGSDLLSMFNLEKLNHIVKIDLLHCHIFDSIGRPLWLIQSTLKRVLINVALTHSFVYLAPFNFIRFLIETIAAILGNRNIKSFGFLRSI